MGDSGHFQAPHRPWVGIRKHRSAVSRPTDLASVVTSWMLLGQLDHSAPARDEFEWISYLKAA